MTTNSVPLEQQLYDIYSVAYVPWWHTTSFYVACGILASLILGLLLTLCIYYYRARYGARTPWDVALQALDRLSKQNVQPDQSRLFYYTLTDIIKSYLVRRYGYQLADKTDEECIAYLAATDFPRELHESVVILFKSGTLGKFAGAQVTQATMREQIALARDLIKRTIPQPTH